MIGPSGTDAVAPITGIHANTVRPTKKVLLEVRAGQERHHQSHNNLAQPDFTPHRFSSPRHQFTLYLLDTWREYPLYPNRKRAALARTGAVTLVSPIHARTTRRAASFPRKSWSRSPLRLLDQRLEPHRDQHSRGSSGAQGRGWLNTDEDFPIGIAVRTSCAAVARARPALS